MPIDDGEVVLEPADEGHQCAEGYWRRRCVAAEKKLDRTISDLWHARKQLREAGIEDE